jgi:predicted amidohydrolase
VERAEGRTYNTMMALAPDGRVLAAYRKRHPWYVETWASPGEASIAFASIAGATCAIAICFDLHFLANESARELAAADVLLFPSAWVEEIDSRPALLADLALRFEVAIVNANWGHGVPAVRGQGGSCVVGDGGRTIARAPRGRGPHRVDATLPIRARANG